MSETLREEKGEEEVAEDEDAHDQADGVGDAHRSSTLTSSQQSANTAARIAR
jgi:hypothetical protein